MGAIEFVGRDQIHPGDEAEALIHFPKPEYVAEYLRPGQTFEIAEGPRNVGGGTILMVGET